MKLCHLNLISLIILLSSCSTTLKIHELNENGQLPTDSKVSPPEILVEKPKIIDTSLHILLIKSANKMNTYNNYIIGTLKNIGVIKDIMTTEDMEQYVIKNNLADKVLSISDNIGLYRLQKEIGDFLICETNVEKTGPSQFDFRFHFKITDASSSETLLEINHYAYNWAGLDKPLFNPVFNYYIDWLKKNKK